MHGKILYSLSVNKKIFLVFHSDGISTLIVCINCQEYGCYPSDEQNKIYFGGRDLTTSIFTIYQNFKSSAVYPENSLRIYKNIYMYSSEKISHNFPKQHHRSISFRGCYVFETGLIDDWVCQNEYMLIQPSAKMIFEKEIKEKYIHANKFLNIKNPNMYLSLGSSIKH